MQSSRDPRSRMAEGLIVGLKRLYTLYIIQLYTTVDW